MLWKTFTLLGAVQATDMEPGLLNVVLQAGAMGLLGLIVVLLFKHAPQIVNAHREGMTALAQGHLDTSRASRDQLDRIVDAIRQDRHADRELTHKQLMEFRLETKELRDSFLREAVEQRRHDEEKTERLMAVINDQKSATVSALHKIDESHRLLADAIRGITESRSRNSAPKENP